MITPEIRQTIRVNEDTHPEEYAYLLYEKRDNESWAECFRRVVQKAMQFDMGNPQLTRIEQQLASLQAAVATLPHTALQAVERRETIVPEYNSSFGKGFEEW